MVTEIIFDVETKKIFDEIEGNDPGDLGVSIVSLYHRQLDDDLSEIKGQMYSFFEEDFPQMWPLLSNVDRVIGFNTLKFDLPALKPYAPFDLRKLKHLDILDLIKQAIGYRISLDDLAQVNLDRQKIDHGLNAVLYWNQHTPDSLKKLQKYCQADVLVTRDLYDFVLKNKFLKYVDKWNTTRTIPLDFSYPSSSSTAQIGLF